MKRIFIAFIIVAVLLLGGGIFMLKDLKQNIEEYNNEHGTLDQSGGNGPAAFGDTLVDSSIGDADLLNPILAGDSASGDINGLVYNGLVKYDKNLILVGDLAESWDISKDGLVITFHLRKGVKWHDGVDFTSADVEFTYNKLVDDKTMSPYKGSYGKDVIKKFEVLDKYTVRVTYPEPFAPALESWGMGIIPKHLLEGKDINKDAFNRKPVGTGPYKFSEWKATQYIKLEYFKDYFEGRPYLDKYLYRIIPDQMTQFIELKAGSIDMMTLTPDMYKKQGETPEFKAKTNKYEYHGFNYSYLAFNLKNQLFADKRVRKAIAHTIDKKSIIDNVLLGLGREATGPFHPDSWAYNPKVRGVPLNLRKARELLKEAGWADTDRDGILEKDGKKFEFQLITNQGNKARELVATIIQEQLKKIGIKVNLRIIAWNIFISEYVDKHKFDAVVLGWSLGRDPDMYEIWHSSKTKEKEYNFVSYSNPEVDKLLIEGRRTFDLEKRKKAYYRIHELIAEDLPYVFIYVPDSLVAADKRIKGIEVAPAGISYNFNKWYVPAGEQKYKNTIQK